jgi:hypothetical protein
VIAEPLSGVTNALVIRSVEIQPGDHVRPLSNDYFLGQRGIETKRCVPAHVSVENGSAERSLRRQSGSESQADVPSVHKCQIGNLTGDRFESERARARSRNNGGSAADVGTHISIGHQSKSRVSKEDGERTPLTSRGDASGQQAELRLKRAPDKGLCRASAERAAKTSE